MMLQSLSSTFSVHQTRALIGAFPRIGVPSLHPHEREGRAQPVVVMVMVEPCMKLLLVK